MGNNGSKNGSNKMTKLEVLYRSIQTPGWINEAIKHCLLRDPLQAANEAEMLAQALRERAINAFTSTKEN